MVVRPLKGQDAFNIVMRSGRRSTSGPLSLTAAFNVDSLPKESISVGVTIGKRTAKRAVIRNRVKRLLRESVRQIVPSRAVALSSAGIHSVVLVWRSAPEAPKLLRLSDVQPHVESALDHVISVCSRNV
ncbi:MAG: ribonuclease P protein component [Candidatus Kapabacteria bacterium]|nr:ribonuclease P protein component [Candidatus Kapabacteria bacterium]